MVATITDAFIRQFSSNVHSLLEQKGSKLIAHIDMERVTGEKAFYERIGSIDASEITSRHADINIQDAPHSRRMLTIKDYQNNVFFDRQDKIKMLIDPTNIYARKLAHGLGKILDSTIIEALLGTANTGSDGAGTVVLPSAQKIAAGGVGLTFEKILEAKIKFDANEYDGPLTCFISAAGLEDLLQETEIQNIDTNTVRALVNGEINTFMGMQFIKTQRIPNNGSDQRAIVVGEDALKLGMAMDLTTEMDRIPMKHNNLLIQSHQSFGAVRMEEEQVVEISFV